MKLILGRETERMIQDDPAAFKLLTTIAVRADRNGEAMVGDYRNYGLSRQEYRSALLRLRNNHQNSQQITISATNKGTIAKLVNNNIYDINVNGDNQPDNQQKKGKTENGNEH